jgi:hypothetical protein
LGQGNTHPRSHLAARFRNLGAFFGAEDVIRIVHSLVITDTSPLNYLVLTGEVELLRRLYSRVVVPDAVLRELQDTKAPATDEIPSPCAVPQ